MPHYGFWTEENTEAVKKLWNQGLSASVIGDRLGCSRNTVIGKVRRLELPYRSTSTRASIERRRVNAFPLRPTRVQPKKKGNDHSGQVAAMAKEQVMFCVKTGVAKLKPEFEAKIKDADPLPPPEPFVGGILLIDLPRNGCRWPLNAPERGEEYLFCGDPSIEGKPYCSRHCCRAYQNGTAYRRRPRPEPVSIFEESEAAAA